jgi:hypothetical protein
MKREWNITTEERYLWSVEKVLSRRPWPNTYKFAIVRALADCMLGHRFTYPDMRETGAIPKSSGSSELPDVW